MRGHQNLLGLYVPGGSVLHRAPLWAKALALLVPTLAALIIGTSPATLTVSAWLVVAALASKLQARVLVRFLVPMLPVLVILGGYQWWLRGWEPAFVVVVNILAAVFAARLITLTTPGPRLLSGLESMARPLKPLGADPERFGLTMVLMLRSIPYLVGSIHDVRDAARARGLERNPRAVVAPVIVNAVGYARQTGEALTARGLGEPRDS